MAKVPLTLAIGEYDHVRDLTSGHAVRDIEVAVQGNALKLKKAIEKLGGKTWGEDEATRSLYLCFPGTVRVDVVSAHRREYPKRGSCNGRGQDDPSQRLIRLIHVVPKASRIFGWTICPA